MFYLNQVTGDQLKWLSWFVMGALVEYNTKVGGDTHAEGGSYCLYSDTPDGTDMTRRHTSG